MKLINWYVIAIIFWAYNDSYTQHTHSTKAKSMETILIIPGLGDSGEQHWQAHWLKKYPNAKKVVQHNWDTPLLENWLTTLNKDIESADGNVILVAHSLAVSLVLHWAKKYQNPKIKGVLLVAPADVNSPTHTPDVVRNFAPMPLIKLPFPSIVIASENDPFVDIARAKFFAEKWGSEFVNIGSKGHINSASNLAYWEDGQRFLEKLQKNN